MSMNPNEKLFSAIKEKRLDLVNEYLKFSSLSTIDWAGNTALHLAVLSNDIEIVKCLIRSGANLNQANKFKKIALHLACQQGNESIANLLLESGSDVNARDMLSMTPLMWSIERNHDNLVILLCGYDGVNLNSVDKFNRNCFDICQQNSNDFIFKILTNAKETIKKESVNSLINSNLNQLEMFVDENSTSNMDTLSVEIQPSTSSGFSFKNVNKSKSLLLLNDSDESSDGENFMFNETKKKRFSFSPIQSAEETLFWLKKQAISNSNEYLLNCELSLTEAGKLTLDYLNKKDPIGDQHRFLMRIAKEIEDQDKEAHSDKESTNLNDKFGENLDDWFIDSINFDTDKNEFF